MGIIKQLWCWIKTGHKDKKQLRSLVLSVYAGSNKIKNVKIPYKCKNCGFIGSEIKHND